MVIGPDRTNETESDGHAGHRHRRLEGKVALITGTASGQGRAAAIRFAEEGARVVGCDVKVGENRETQRLVERAGGLMITMQPVDLTNESEVEAWIDAGAEACDGFDIIYNNAALARYVPFGEMSFEDWSYTLRGDLDVVFLGCRYAWRHLVARGGGVIINTSSTAALQGARWIGMAAHSAAKAGVVALTRQLAAEGAAHNIRAVSILPGPIDSDAPTMKKMLALPGGRERIAATTLVNRVGQPRDVANLAVFLASDDAAFITGCQIPVDGGGSSAGASAELTSVGRSAPSLSIG
jgi:NAD(P)-dependent dehydrogenase (short-subunit alcohol dehydrogenase family)